MNFRDRCSGELDGGDRLRSGGPWRDLDVIQDAMYAFDVAGSIFGVELLK
jgi:hypothetical protein